MPTAIFPRQCTWNPPTENIKQPLLNLTVSVVPGGTVPVQACIPAALARDAICAKALFVPIAAVNAWAAI